MSEANQVLETRGKFDALMKERKTLTLDQQLEQIPNVKY